MAKMPNNGRIIDKALNIKTNISTEINFQKPKNEHKKYFLSFCLLSAEFIFPKLHILKGPRTLFKDKAL